MIMVWIDNEGPILRTFKFLQGHVYIIVGLGNPDRPGKLTLCGQL